MCGHGFWSADYPNVKLLVQVADVGRWRRSHARWRQPVATKATVPDTQSRQHMVLEEAFVPPAVQVERVFQELEEHSKNHVCVVFFYFDFRVIWIMNRYHLNGKMKPAQNSDFEIHVKM